MIAAGYAEDGSIPATRPNNHAIMQCAPLTPTRREYLAWAGDFKSAAAFRENNARASWGGPWWLNLENNFKCYLLVMVCGEDWERWHACGWLAIPDNLQDEIMLQLRTLSRELGAVSWR